MANEPRRLAAAGAGNEDLWDLSFSLNSVNNLIPDHQEVVSIPPDRNVLDAIMLMQANGFSQVPIIQGGVVLGSFSYRSFAQGVIQAQRHGQRIESLQVADCLESLHFAHVTDGLTDLLDEFDRRDAVLVGGPDRLLGLATTADALRFLFRLASPFILLQEIELALRHIIGTSIAPGTLESVIRKSIGQQYSDAPDKMPNSLDALSMAQYGTIICARDNYRLFQEVLGPNRTWTQSKLVSVNQLRNDVMHFRRQLTSEDLGTLISVREWLFLRLRVAKIQRSDR